ncbi:hypothetical protein Bca4012_089106 [Brassica carinata]
MVHILTNVYLFLQNDGLHFRQPWVTAIHEEVERLKERYHEQAKLLRVENERNGYTQYDTSEFEEGTSTRSSNVDAPNTSEMPPNLANMLLIRTHLRDRQLHERLKNDLVENIWNKFGNDEDE